MKREIKFRAWNGWKIEPNIVVGQLGAFYALIDPHDSACLNPTTKYYGETPIMQSTGVIDKNGVEIYEGDIIKYCRFINNGVEEWATGNGVVFHHGCFWTGDRVATGSFLTNDYKDGDPALMYWQSPQWLEIIGNIYENKE